MDSPSQPAELPGAPDGPARPGSPLVELGRALADLLYPPVCLTCGAMGPPFCPRCRCSILPLGPGAPVPRGLKGCRSVGYHKDALRRAVLRLKFQRKVALLPELGGLLVEELKWVRESWEPDLLVPVPIHWTRRLQRGFNQSELLAREVGAHTGLPVECALRRVRDDGPQVGRGREARLTALAGAMGLVPECDVAGRRVVLVDDVRTTGATLAEAARALHEAGAKSVFAVTLTYDE